MADNPNESGALSLSNLKPPKGARRRRKRLGKGEGSGSGKTCGRGTKGQRSRSGASIPAGFEGGQMPLDRRLPKWGFTSRKRVRGENVYNIVSLDRLQSLEGHGELTLDRLREGGLVKSRASKVKILGGGEVVKPLIVEAHAISKSAKAAIEAAGGEVRLISFRAS